ncbi:MAG TPA: heavy metal translocating P-type ATPase, partial [Hyphomicrobiaceae bacterium]|nr:heavy metal translocating P-type ATPase [Hyphomicrobiaceae bacterium]
MHWVASAGESDLRRLLVAYVILGLVAGLAAYGLGQPRVAHALWIVATLPVVTTLGASIVRDFAAGRAGVDAIAFVSMTTALVLGEPLAATVVAVMYSGGMLLEDLAVARANRDLRLLIDRAPRIAHLLAGGTVRDVGIDAVVIGDTLLVRSGEVIPVDGKLLADRALIDEAALTGEALPLARLRGDPLRSGTLNAGPTFEMRATAAADSSTYAGIIRLVTAAQTAKAPFMRLADRFALILLPDNSMKLLTPAL